MENTEKSDKSAAACGSGSCCTVEAVVAVDDRGQFVLPKEIRERAGIRAGDKLALVAWEKDGSLCCLTLIKTAELGVLVQAALEPMIGTMEG